jgi:glucose/arabinose dehydrogenase
VQKRVLALASAAAIVLASGGCNADTHPATQVTHNSAQLRAIVDWDSGEEFSYWFEYRRVGTTGWTRDDFRGPFSFHWNARGVTIGEHVSGLAPGVTYEYRICGFLTAPSKAGSINNPVCFDSDRSRDPPHDYDTLTTDPPAIPPGFTQKTMISGLTNPTAVSFSPDGRVFVAEKRGVIKEYSDLSDTNPTVVTDLRQQVYDYGDGGLLGMELDPQFPSDSSIYVLYTRDAPIGGTAPTYNDDCTAVSCLTSARLSRIQPDGGEQVLIEDWCKQYPSHSIGSLNFGPDGALYVTAGEGASWNFVDYGQSGNPPNPCGDPPGGVGTALSPPSAQGGALRAQDLRTPADPTTLDGAVLRLDPDTGAAMPDNPLSGSSDPNARRIVAYGFRNPFRATFRPGTNELWIADVGWNDWEEINRLVTPAASPVENFGWPCYEGQGRQPGYDAVNLTICENLYSEAGAVTAPFRTYSHAGEVVPNDACPLGGSSISGLAFAPQGGGAFPAEYGGALFFADASRSCIWVMKASGGLPNPSNTSRFVRNAAVPVDLEIGPGGDLFYVDLFGTVRRIQYSADTNGAPTAVARADPTSGQPPLTVAFDATGSSDPEGDALSYAWDLDGDGAFDDAGAASPAWAYNSPGNHVATVRVTDALGASDTDSITIAVGGPTVTIDAPTPDTTWAVGDTVSFSGSATDNGGNPIPAGDLSWSLVLRHGECPLCHTHPLSTFPGVSSGSFNAPDHEYPSSLELSLTATDSGGLRGTERVVLQPQTTTLRLESQPSGLTLGLNSETQETPFSRTVIVGSTNTISAPSPQDLDGHWFWESWSDDGAQTHDVTAPSGASTTYTAIYGP